MKLNYKRTILVGMAFFLISAFWQAYDAIIPLILTNHFGLPQTASGTVMSIDNVLAVFLLPIFGALSDKVSTRFGKRTPFILIGSVIAMVSFVALTFIDNYQIAKVVAAGIPEIVQSGAEDEMIRKLTVELTIANPAPFIGFIATLLVVLLAMATFRSPASSFEIIMDYFACLTHGGSFSVQSDHLRNMVMHHLPPLLKRGGQSIVR